MGQTVDGVMLQVRRPRPHPERLPSGEESRLRHSPGDRD